MAEWPAVMPLRPAPPAVDILDQRRLPAASEWIRCRSATAVAGCIRDMVIRGAPAIGLAAAYGLAVAAAGGEDLAAAAALLLASRPTAVNLAVAVRAQLATADSASQQGADVVAALWRAAVAWHRADIAANQALGRAGAALVPDGADILTHCNTGGLATGGYGTALGIVRAAWAAGWRGQVWATETRPYWQGARLTAWELVQEHIPVRVIPDLAAGAVLAGGRVGVVLVGADRVAQNGDVANKIGTYALAVLARWHKVPLVCAAPEATIDRETPTGAAIPIEERPAAELAAVAGQVLVPAGAEVHNPAFDVTPAALVSAWVSERGVRRPPF